MSQPSSATDAPSVEEACRNLPLSDPARSLIAPEMTQLGYIGALLENGYFKDLFLFAAARLPKREAVWWGCLCAWHIERPDPPPALAAAYQAVVRWLEDPSEANRREAEAAAGAAPRQGLGTAIAQAVFYSEGSISPPGLPEVVPPRSLYIQVIANTVFLASRLADPVVTIERVRFFVRTGWEVLKGQNRW